MYSLFRFPTNELASNEFAQTVSGNAQFWLNFVAESRLRVENLRILHHLALSTPDVEGMISPKVDLKGLIVPPF